MPQLSVVDELTVLRIRVDEVLRSPAAEDYCEPALVRCEKRTAYQGAFDTLIFERLTHQCLVEAEHSCRQGGRDVSDEDAVLEEFESAAVRVVPESLPAVRYLGWWRDVGVTAPEFFRYSFVVDQSLERGSICIHGLEQIGAPLVEL